MNHSNERIIATDFFKNDNYWNKMVIPIYSNDHVIPFVSICYEHVMNELYVYIVNMNWDY